MKIFMNIKSIERTSRGYVTKNFVFVTQFVFLYTYNLHLKRRNSHD